ncbi:MAG: hypothetical protein U1F43_12005 [Myxococcota bacterium]
MKQWELSRIMLELGVKDDILVTNLRPFLRGVRPGGRAASAGSSGTGLVRAALADAKRLDEPRLGNGYFDSLEGELDFQDGHWSDAINLGEKALGELQKQNALMRWRTMTYIAGALAEEGQGSSASAVKYLREVLHNFPSALRHLQVKVPVEVSYDNGPLLAMVANALLDSRRFSVQDGAPFKIHVGGKDDHPEICLAAADGFRIGCVDKEVDPKKADAVGKAVDAFIAGIFSPKVAFTSSDINSLDGSTVRQDSDKALEGILGNDFKPKDDGDDE